MMVIDTINDFSIKIKSSFKGKRLKKVADKVYI